MLDIVILTHGDLAKGFHHSCNMITGQDLNYIGLYEDGIGNFEEKVYKLLDELLSIKDGVLVLCDIRGGSPCNTALRYKLEKNAKIEIVIGVNLPMILSCLDELENDITLQELVNIAVENGKLEIETINI